MPLHQSPTGSSRQQAARAAPARGPGGWRRLFCPRLHGLAHQPDLTLHLLSGRGRMPRCLHRSPTGGRQAVMAAPARGPGGWRRSYPLRLPRPVHRPELLLPLFQLPPPWWSPPGEGPCGPELLMSSPRQLPYLPLHLPGLPLPISMSHLLQQFQLLRRTSSKTVPILRLRGHGTTTSTNILTLLRLLM